MKTKKQFIKSLTNEQLEFFEHELNKVVLYDTHRHKWVHKTWFRINHLYNRELYNSKLVPKYFTGFKKIQIKIDRIKTSLKISKLLLEIFVYSAKALYLSSLTSNELNKWEHEIDNENDKRYSHQIYSPGRWSVEKTEEFKKKMYSGYENAELLEDHYT